MKNEVRFNRKVKEGFRKGNNGFNYKSTNKNIELEKFNNENNIHYSIIKTSIVKVDNNRFSIVDKIYTGKDGTIITLADDEEDIFYDSSRYNNVKNLYPNCEIKYSIYNDELFVYGSYLDKYVDLNKGNVLRILPDDIVIVEDEKIDIETVLSGGNPFLIGKIVKFKNDISEVPTFYSIVETFLNKRSCSILMKKKKPNILSEFFNELEIVNVDYDLLEVVDKDSDIYPSLIPGSLVKLKTYSIGNDIYDVVKNIGSNNCLLSSDYIYYISDSVSSYYMKNEFLEKEENINFLFIDKYNNKFNYNKDNLILVPFKISKIEEKYLKDENNIIEYFYDINTRNIYCINFKENILIPLDKRYLF